MDNNSQHMLFTEKQCTKGVCIEILSNVEETSDTIIEEEITDLKAKCKMKTCQECESLQKELDYTVESRRSAGEERKELSEKLRKEREEREKWVIERERLLHIINKLKCDKNEAIDAVQVSIGSIGEKNNIIVTLEKELEEVRNKDKECKDVKIAEYKRRRKRRKTLRIQVIQVKL